VLVSPVLWWYSQIGRLNKNRTANIFYENNCTPEEVERFRHQDMIENLGWTMISQPGYGYHQNAEPK